MALTAERDMMFGNSLRMLCLSILTCLLLPHQILSKPVTLAEWVKQEIAKVGTEEVVKELEFYATFNKMIKRLAAREKRVHERFWNLELTKGKAIHDLQDMANADAGVLRLFASKLEVHDSPLLTVQQFEEIAKVIINRRIPGLHEIYCPSVQPRDRGHQRFFKFWLTTLLRTLHLPTFVLLTLYSAKYTSLALVSIAKQAHAKRQRQNLEEKLF